jgi:hypothetical protein
MFNRNEIVIARSDSDEAIQLYEVLDCFASLAMTKSDQPNIISH